MNCAFSKETLALHAGGDLSESETLAVIGHLQKCDECTLFTQQLVERQSMLKLLKQDCASPAALSAMRRNVMSAVESPALLPWRVRLERSFVAGLRRHTYAFAALALAAAVSVSLLAEMRIVAPATFAAAAAFDGKDTLLLPEGYRDWVSVGDSFGPHDSTAAATRKVFMDRSAYREYSQTGKFPEGTVMVLELSGSGSNTPTALQASVKDNRFDGGWGFFNFTASDGKIQAKANALPAGNTCRSCHEEHAGKDHVYTQFYPALKLVQASFPGRDSKC